MLVRLLEEERREKAFKIPCVYVFSVPNKLVKRLPSLLQETNVYYSFAY